MRKLGIKSTEVKGGYLLCCFFSVELFNFKRRDSVLLAQKSIKILIKVAFSMKISGLFKYFTEIVDMSLLSGLVEHTAAEATINLALHGL